MANVSVSLLTLTIKAVLYWAGDVKQTLYVSSRAPGAPFYIERDSYRQAGQASFPILFSEGLLCWPSYYSTP